MLLIIDNYDSFTYNLFQYFSELGQKVQVYRNDAIGIDQIKQLNPSYLVISPGPCTPLEAGISVPAIQYFCDKLPILGVCLGHQSIGQAFGAKIVHAKKLMHGKVSSIEHNNRGLFHGLSSPLTVTRYHSLVIDQTSLPDCLEITAWDSDRDTEIAIPVRFQTTGKVPARMGSGGACMEIGEQHNLANDTALHSKNDGCIMGIRHKTMPIQGVQFHPESILTECGHAMLENFLLGKA